MAQCYDAIRCWIMPSWRVAEQLPADLAKVMFPDKLVMLKEHFRCVEPIIRFSMPFYPEPLVPLRVPTAQERLDPLLVDIYVEDGQREGDKLNPREAEVVVEEVRSFVEDPVLARVPGDGRPRTIGGISLIGAKQTALINKRLLDFLGEETILRHHIACGDSATFQGNERDVVFLSMVADPRLKQAQTAAHFEQRFNVALSRARDRIVLVRSVTEEELNPQDLKARVIRHFAEPMPEATASGPLEAACESDFERAVLRCLVERGFRVTPQVGAHGYCIDLVVEGGDGRRLAVECDGDRYHGPERWADDMRRQRVLERVGWRFGRVWASSFTLTRTAAWPTSSPPWSGWGSSRRGRTPSRTVTRSTGRCGPRRQIPRRSAGSRRPPRPAGSGSVTGWPCAPWTTTRRRPSP
jgi:very-short-patch-repair endonuclease